MRTGMAGEARLRGYRSRALKGTDGGSTEPRTMRTGEHGRREHGRRENGRLAAKSSTPFIIKYYEYIRGLSVTD